MKNVRVILVASLLALFAVLMVFTYIKKREAKIVEMSTPVRVVVAASNISEGGRLDESNITIMEVPKQFSQPDSLDNVENLFDRIVTIPILEGTQILESMLASPEQAGLSQKIPKDKVGYTVAVNSVTGVAGLLQPGDYVNVMLTVEVGIPNLEVGYKDQETMTLVALENTLVLAVDRRTTRIFVNQMFNLPEGSPGNLFNKDQARGSQSRGVETITLAVDPGDCLKLTMAQEIGTVSVALHSSWSDGQVWENKKLGSHDFLGIEKPVIRQAVPAWVEIRGASQTSRF